MKNILKTRIPIIEPIGRFWDFLTQPHPSITEVGERQRAQLLSALSLVFVVLFTWAILSTPRILTDFLIFLGITLTTYIISRTRFYTIGAYFFSFTFTSIAFINIYNGSSNTIDTSITSIVPISLILASVILSQRGFLILGIATVAATATMRSYADPKFLADPLFSYGRTIGIVSSMTMVLYYITFFRAGLERARLKEVQEINRELESLSTGLEQRVAEQTKALTTSAEISRTLIAILDLRQLANEVVNQIQTAFNYYYVQIYLFDEAGENLVLTAGSGEAGVELMKRGHSLPKGRGLVGRAAATNTFVLVPDISTHPDWLPNPVLPDTKSEVAVPISLGDQVLGVLDVQHNVAGGLKQDDADLLLSIASQVAIAVRNADQFEQKQKAESALRAVVESTSAQVGEHFFQSLVEHLAITLNVQHAFVAQLDAANNRVRTRAFWKYNLLAENVEYSLEGTPCSNVIAGSLCVYPRSVQDLFPRDLDLVALDAQSYIGIPLYDSAGEILGHLAVLDTEPMRDEEFRKSVLQIFAARAGAELERQQAEETLAQRARRQEAINLIAQKIQAATTIEEAMQVAARELGHALGKRQTLVALEPSALGGNGQGY